MQTAISPPLKRLGTVRRRVGIRRRCRYLCEQHTRLLRWTHRDALLTMRLSRESDSWPRVIDSPSPKPDEDRRNYSGAVVVPFRVRAAAAARRRLCTCNRAHCAEIYSAVAEMHSDLSHLKQWSHLKQNWNKTETKQFRWNKTLLCVCFVSVLYQM